MPSVMSLVCSRYLATVCRLYPVSSAIWVRGTFSSSIRSHAFLVARAAARRPRSAVRLPMMSPCLGWCQRASRRSGMTGSPCSTAMATLTEVGCPAISQRYRRHSVGEHQLGLRSSVDLSAISLLLSVLSLAN
nr:MAG TPA: hypothetical protein [Caudoviricetes sp.]